MRWSLCWGGYPHGWEPPVVESDDPYVVIKAYESIPTPYPHMSTVAIFDDNGEGRPLDPEAVEEILDNEYEAS